MRPCAALPAALGCALVAWSSSTMEQRASPPSLGGGEHAAARSHAKAVFTREEVSKHSTRDDLWGVVDGYVLDLTGFVGSHPGGVGKILGITREGDFSFARGANAHFGATASAFREAAGLSTAAGSQEASSSRSRTPAGTGAWTTRAMSLAMRLGPLERSSSSGSWQRHERLMREREGSRSAVCRAGGDSNDG
eukprot:CAMPEP_0179279504 /NCGR_PEP_ID=MMETSP0797-20121207/36148_1 /TAXON_ID=47934 /ORGANISM="Dinophysis acuminata, Strain DAEP01" /LENGTH=192 /DNA_ID=CAMNT_0020988135 /DNA_START=36 /DNA_END=612 /DNA_ORIENTATION=+